LFDLGRQTAKGFAEPVGSRASRASLAQGKGLEKLRRAVREVACHQPARRAVNLTGMSAAFALDQSLPVYQPVTGISGQLKSVGSDTLKIAMTLWAKRFKDLYPGRT
jgi:hypothetical protein